jgi:hypothetical protein
MKKAILAALALTTVATAVPAVAQPTAWNRETAWRGAPDGLQQRIDWLQQRIDRGRQDGSLSRSEAQRAQRDLELLSRDASVLDRRLDDLSRNIRWSRGNGYGYDDRPGGGYAGGPGGAYAGGGNYSTDYDASRYYRDDARYTERRLSNNDEVYRGSDGRYYCKRNDGTTGLIIGGAGGALLGNVIDGGRSRIGGTLIGGALGALLGKSVDQNQSDYRCR